MKLENVIELLKNGFTADEIRAMAADEPPAENTEEQPTEQMKFNLDPPAGSTPDKPSADNPELVRLFEGLQQSINNLQRAIQANSARGTEIGSPTDDSVESALAEIINPKEVKLNNG